MVLPRGGCPSCATSSIEKTLAWCHVIAIPAGSHAKEKFGLPTDLMILQLRRNTDYYNPKYHVIIDGGVRLGN